ncbi:MAG: methionine adenosyltransferase [Acidimicrobiia bacterium]
MDRNFLFTSESVTEGHPDKVADQVSDAVLDAVLEQDETGRVACETLITTGMVIVAGEISTTAQFDLQKLVRQTIREIGYTKAEYGFDADACGVMVCLDEQSPDIAIGVDKALEVRSEGSSDARDEQGAGDQGMMFGFACDETPDLMPMPIWLAHRLAKQLAKVRKSGQLKFLRPDGKTQVTIEYENGRPKRLHTLLISAQHDPDVTTDELKDALFESVVRPVVADHIDSSEMKVLVNPTGRFEIGGPHADTGLTGRKVIVDTYGGYARHGGGAFSGKDPSKVDRSGAYAARWIAKNIVAAGLARRCEVQIAYAIGKSRPVSVMLETFGTSKIDEEKLQWAISDVFDLRPLAIIERLQLRRPIYRKTAAYGHFGRSDSEFTWEASDAAQELKDRFL